jgi:hypothetical protein
MVKKLLSSIVLFIVGFVICLKLFESSIIASIGIGYILMSIPWAWGFTGDKLGRRRFTLVGGIGDAVHWGLRIGLSIILGAVFFPIEVVNLILAHRKSKPDIERNPS